MLTRRQFYRTLLYVFGLDHLGDYATFRGHGKYFVAY